jgi:hypothetical protein
MHLIFLTMPKKNYTSTETELLTSGPSLSKKPNPEHYSSIDS